MTGFARQSAETGIGTLTWELRAVNHRYLDVQFRLPEELRASEQEFKHQIAELVKRGKIECSLRLRRSFDADNDLRVDIELVRVIRKRVTELSTELRDTLPLNPFEILRWPGVICENEIDVEPVNADAGKLLAAALDEITAMRASEGERIAAMLEARCADVAKLVDSVRKRLPTVLEAAHAKQRDRLERLDVAADPARLEVELALISQKLDVDEELDRLDSHLAEIRQALAADEPVGRRLDFLMQELNREANTLGSKSADADTTRAAVDLKVLIEQMREQVQNVE